MFSFILLMRFCLIFLLLTSCSSFNNSSHPPIVVKAIAEPEDHKIYVVKPKDTIYSIAWAYNIDIATIKKVNKIDSTNHLLVGQRLVIPSESSDLFYDGSVPVIVTKTNKTMMSLETKENVLNKESTNINSRVKLSKKITKQKLKANKLAKYNLKHIAFSHWYWPKSTFWYAKAPWHGIWVRSKIVRATSNGVVVYNGDGIKGYGHLIILKHAKGILSAYGNVSSVKVVVGKRIKKGQILAYAKRKFYLEVRAKGRAIDLRRYL